jgi:hypothetical protein
LLLRAPLPPQAQEELLALDWPPELLQHRHCAPVHLGDVCGAASAGKGPRLMAGLRVRMGVNTGALLGAPAAAAAAAARAPGRQTRASVNPGFCLPSPPCRPNAGCPSDVFIHDVTQHVDYRGVQYELAAEICDMAAGGQVLMGPRTYQR